MANSCNSIPKFISPNKFDFPHSRSLIRSLRLPVHSQLHFQAYASSRKSKWKEDGEEFEDTVIKERKRERKRRSLISVSPAGERWDSKWNCDYVLTLSELELRYLAADGEQEPEVHVSLALQQHTGFGLSIHGRVVTSFNRECNWCSKIFFKEIDTTFDVTVLPEPKETEFGLPELGGDDSVIYVKYGFEADLDSFIQDKILVATLGQDTCSEKCGDTPIVLYSNEQDYEPRWPQLLRLKQALLEKETQLGVEKGSDPDSK